LDHFDVAGINFIRDTGNRFNRRVAAHASETTEGAAGRTKKIIAPERGKNLTHFDFPSRFSGTAAKFSKERMI
jgi:hypothetical protein